MSDEVARLTAEVQELLPLVAERDRLAEERRELDGRLAAADARITEVTYQRDLLRWRLDRLRSRRFIRAVLATLDAVKRPSRLLRLPAELWRVLTVPARPLPEPVRPSPTTTTGAADRIGGDSRSDAQLRQRHLVPATPGQLRELRVAGILDTFTTACFAPECDLLTFRPDNWREVLAARPPHLLFVESAWHGNDGAWQHQVGTYRTADAAGLPHLTALVEWCRDQDVPTVFWNKEDPVHFEKFKEAAQLFDVVLTTDADMVPRYEELPRLRATTVAALPFAAQPTIHNPVMAPAERVAKPVFAGTYYRTRHRERREQLEMLLDAAVPHGLVVFDRMHGSESDQVGYPERFLPHVRGGLAYDEMVEAYRRYRVFLNTNSVTASPTMFSRRVFELLASGTPVVSTPSVGMERMLGDVLDVVDDHEAASAAITALLTDEEHWRTRSRAGIREVMREHTYAHRLATVARLAGFALEVDEPRATAVALDAGATGGFAGIREIAASGVVEGVLLGGTGQDVPPPHPSVVRVRQDAATDEPDRFRELADRAATEWLLVLGDGSTRAVAVEELLAATVYADADVIGVAADGEGAVPVRDRYVDELLPAPALVRRELVVRHGWTRDPAAIAPLLAALRARGHRLFATDVTGTR